LNGGGEEKKRVRLPPEKKGKFPNKWWENNTLILIGVRNLWMKAEAGCKYEGLEEHRVYIFYRFFLAPPLTFWL